MRGDPGSPWGMWRFLVAVAAPCCRRLILLGPLSPLRQGPVCTGLLRDAGFSDASCLLWGCQSHPRASPHPATALSPPASVLASVLEPCAPCQSLVPPPPEPCAPCQSRLPPPEPCAPHQSRLPLPEPCAPRQNRVPSARAVYRPPEPFARARAVCPPPKPCAPRQSCVPPAKAMCLLLRACPPTRLDFEGLEGGEDGALEKLRAWSRSIEDLQHPSALPAPFASSLARSARQTALRYVPRGCPTVRGRPAMGVRPASGLCLAMALLLAACCAACRGVCQHAMVCAGVPRCVPACHGVCRAKHCPAVACTIVPGATQRPVLCHAHHLHVTNAVPGARAVPRPWRGCAVARATRAASCSASRAVSALPARATPALPSLSGHRRPACPLPTAAPLTPALALAPRPGVMHPVSASRAGVPLSGCALSLSPPCPPRRSPALRVSTGCPGPAQCRVCRLCPSRPPTASLCLCPSEIPAVPTLSPHSPSVPTRVSAGGAAPAGDGPAHCVPCPAAMGRCPAAGR